MMQFEYIWLLCMAFTIAFVIPMATEDYQTTYNALKEIQAKINSNIEKFCYPGHSGTKNAFLRNAYKEYTGKYNVLVYPFCLSTHELGNRLGNYFQEVACADASGLHFITVHPQWDMAVSYQGNSTNSTVTASEEQRLAFLRALPDIIVHPQPLDRFHGEDRVKQACHCTRYCWQQVTAPWVNRTDLLGGYLQKAMVAYRSALEPDAATAVDTRTDFTNAQPGQFLPIIPDTAIQYRCGDNIGFSYLYGILPFTTFVPYIPADTKFLYVLSDHPSRAMHSPYTSRCHLILENLFNFLRERFPRATIVVKRGGDLFLDYVRLGRAKVTICSASSYCFWPAVSNKNGKAYFPVTSLIAGADNLQLAPSFGPHFHWVDAEVISNMKKFRPWTQIIDVLTGKRPMPE